MPLQFFPNEKAWANHMQIAHSVQWSSDVHKIKWYCDVDHPVPQEFTSKEQFEAHMRDTKIHKSTPTDLQLAALSRRQQGSVPREEFACPICECVPNTIKLIISQSRKGQAYRELSQHIGEHLKPLAFISLPLLDAPNDIQDPQSKSDIIKPSLKRLRNEGSAASVLSGWDDEIRSLSLAFDDPPTIEIQSLELDDPQYYLVLGPHGRTQWPEWDSLTTPPPFDPEEDPIWRSFWNAGGGIRPNDIVIAIMGLTGTGKSTFISHFCQTARIGHGLEACKNLKSQLVDVCGRQ